MAELDEQRHRPTRIIDDPTDRTPDPKDRVSETTVIETETQEKKPWYKRIIGDPPRKWILIPFWLFFGGAIMLFLMDQLLMPFYVKSDDVAIVPHVVGLKKAKAIEKLQAAEYEPVEYEVRFDEKIAEGTVIRQTPESGEETKPGRKVFLVLSGGKEMASVPDLTGRSVRDAKMLLLKSNLSVGKMETAYSESAANGTILKQAPSPGSKISSTTKVDLVVSQGPLYGRVPVPTLKGMTLSDAIAALNAGKLTLGQVTFETRLDGAPNTVVDQYPSSGDLITEGSTVDLFVIREVAPNLDAEN